MTWDDCTEDFRSTSISTHSVPHFITVAITPEPTREEICECGCGLSAHDLLGELGECLACSRCLRWRPVRA